MFKSAPMYFSIPHITIERTSRIELVKLFEGEDKASIRYLRKHISKNANKLCYRRKHITEVESLNKELQELFAVNGIVSKHLRK